MPTSVYYELVAWLIRISGGLKCPVFYHVNADVLGTQLYTQSDGLKYAVLANIRCQLLKTQIDGLKYLSTIYLSILDF